MCISISMATSFLVFAFNINFVAGESHTTTDATYPLGTPHNGSTTEEISRNYTNADLISTQQHLLVERIVSIINESGGHFIGQEEKPGKAEPDDYVVHGHVSANNSNPLSDKPLLTDISYQNHSNNDITKLYSSLPHRPSYAGQTGGYYVQQIIKPGKPLPARPENVGNIGVATKKPQSALQNNQKPNHNNWINFELALGNNIGEMVSNKTDLNPQSPTSVGHTTTLKPLEDQIAHTNSTHPPFDNKHNETGSVSSGSSLSNLLNPSRPSFAGQTGGYYNQQLIKPGKPWPARPEDYANFSVTTKQPSSQLYEKTIDTTSAIPTPGKEITTTTNRDLEDRFEIVLKNGPYQLNLSNSNESSFDGQQRGDVPSQNEHGKPESTFTTNLPFTTQFNKVVAEKDSPNESTQSNLLNTNRPSVAGIPPESTKAENYLTSVVDGKLSNNH